jgi:Fe-S oxidoreductase
MRGQFDRQIPIAVRQANQDSLHCNGNAACFNFDPDDAVCPSWKATRDRRHSPKGRASLMREWLRLLAREGVDPDRAARAAWRDLPARALHSWRARGDGGDFSREVKEAMDGCLSCKSCVGQCPIKVDVPAFRSRFLQAYHGRYLRPARDHLVSRLEAALPLAARAPRLVNGLTHNRFARAAARRLGLVDLPALDHANVARELQRRGIHMATPEALRALTPQERRRSVVIVQDAFTTYYDSAVVLDACELLVRLGFQPWLGPYLPNGKPQYVLGMLQMFSRTAGRNAAMLRALADTGVDLVGIDPSMTLTYRAEYVRALGQEAVPRILLPQEWLAERLDELPDWSRVSVTRWSLLPHCTERTNAPAATADWVKVGKRLGADLQILASGCCGMAGLYGHESANRPTSESIYDLSWRPIMADAMHAERTLATGYSCRCQAALIDDRQLLHPLQMLLRHLPAGS